MPTSHEDHDISHEEHHKKWMISLQYMHKNMKGSLDGTSNISPSKIFNQGFSVTALKMPMDMIMLHVMYRIRDRISLMVMVPPVLLCGNRNSVYVALNPLKRG